MSDRYRDWLAICETKARYCRCLDGKDWDGYSDCFTDDLEMNLPPDGNVIRGRAECMKSVQGWVGTAITAHQVHNPEMAFSEDGSSADVIWAMQDRVTWGEDRREQAGDSGHTGYGYYREQYVKCDDGRWRIRRQKLTYLHMDFYDVTRPK